jgi:hypothetical protein
MFKEKLIELLKENPKIKSNLEDLRFWCKITKIDSILDDWKTPIYWDIWQLIKVTRPNNWWCIFKYYIKIDWFNKIYSLCSNNCKVIWNPIEERFLRMYEHRIIIKWEYIYSSEFECMDTTICRLDNNKSFDNQSEEVYEKIFNYLKQI